MTSINITLELSEEIEEKARLLGLLTSENLSQLISKEVREKQRDWAIQAARNVLSQLDALQPPLNQVD